MTQNKPQPLLTFPANLSTDDVEKMITTAIKNALVLLSHQGLLDDNFDYNEEVIIGFEDIGDTALPSIQDAQGRKWRLGWVRA